MTETTPGTGRHRLPEAHEPGTPDEPRTVPHEADTGPERDAARAREDTAEWEDEGGALTDGPSTANDANDGAS